MDQQNLFTNYSRKRSLSEADSEIYPLTITTKLLTKPTTNLPQTLKQRRLVNKTQTLTNSETQQEITKLESKFDEISEKHNQLANRVQILISEKEQMKNELIQLRKLVQRNEIKQRNQLTKEKKKQKSSEIFNSKWTHPSFKPKREETVSKFNKKFPKTNHSQK